MWTVLLTNYRTEQPSVGVGVPGRFWVYAPFLSSFKDIKVTSRQRGHQSSSVARSRDQQLTIDKVMSINLHLRDLVWTRLQRREIDHKRDKERPATIFSGGGVYNHRADSTKVNKKWACECWGECYSLAFGLGEIIKRETTNYYRISFIFYDLTQGGSGRACFSNTPNWECRKLCSKCWEFGMDWAQYKVALVSLQCIYVFWSSIASMVSDRPENQA